MKDRLSIYGECCDEDELSMWIYSNEAYQKNALAYSFKDLYPLVIQKRDGTIIVRFSVNQMLSYYSESGEPLMNHVKNTPQVLLAKEYNVLDKAYRLSNSDCFIMGNTNGRHNKLVRLKNVHRL